MRTPEGAIIDAVWRCKRGHETPAKFHGAPLENGRTLSVGRLSTISLELEDGSWHDICCHCLVEDYGTVRVEFGAG